MTRLRRAKCSLVIAAAGLAAPAWAQSATGVVINYGATGVDPVRADARELVNRLPTPDASRVQAQTAAAVGRSIPFVSPGADPGSKRVAPRAFGSFGIPYTSTRVQAGPSNQNLSVGGAYLSSTYPYRAIGRLFFRIPGLGFTHCSASLIRRSVIVTAAHCIQDLGDGGSTFTDWVFVPGHYGPTGATLAQREPYGRFSWAAFNRPVTWANGTDPGSGAARNNDLAVIVLEKSAADRPGAASQFVGDLTGWLGYATNNYSFVSSPKTGNLSVAAISTLGYPGLMDDGAIMQRSDGPSYLTTVGGALQIWQGSNFTGGSSGGPWIVNFVSVNPALSGGAAIGREPLRAVVGVTSWGSVDPNAIKDNFSSRFGQNPQYPRAAYGVYGPGNIGALLDEVCNRPVRAGVTYAQAGYCD